MNQRGDDGLETKNNSLLRKKKTNTIRSRADEFHESCNTELLRLSLFLSLGLSEEREKKENTWSYLIVHLILLPVASFLAASSESSSRNGATTKHLLV